MQLLPGTWLWQLCNQEAGGMCHMRSHVSDLLIAKLQMLCDGGIAVCSSHKTGALNSVPHNKLYCLAGW